MNKMILRFTAVFVIALASFAPAMAVEAIDIDQSSGTAGMTGSADWQQTFIPNADNITAVSFHHYAIPGTATVQILDSLCGSIIAHGSGTGVGWVKCDLVGAQALVPGNTYVIKVSSTAAMSGSTANTYADGLLYYSCGLPWGPDWDLYFRTWTDQEAVPAANETWGSIKSMYK